MKIEDVEAAIQRNNEELELENLCRLRAYRLMRYIAIRDLHKLIYTLRGNDKPTEHISREARAAVARFETRVFRVVEEQDASLLHQTVELLDELIVKEYAHLMDEFSI